MVKFESIATAAKTAPISLGLIGVIAAALYFGGGMARPSVAAKPYVAPAAGLHKTVPATLHKTVQVDGLDIFYREAGPEGAPTLLLLHGFPTSSQMFRNLAVRPGPSPVAPPGKYSRVSPRMVP